MNIPDNLVLVLSGGNALGAYHAGGFEALTGHGLQPKRLVGASIGTITAAIIAGNEPEQRLDRLRAFWQRAEQFGKSDPSAVGRLPQSWLRWEKWSAGLQTLLAGRPGLFAPHLFGPWTMLAAGSRKASLLDSSPLPESLRDLIDFDRLNGGETRLTILAVDVETGEEVVFDTKDEKIGPQHIRASASLPPLFQPVDVEGRWLVDGGLSANLPVRLALDEPPAQDTLCIGLDLLPREGRLPRSIGAAAERAQDLAFACQSHHAIRALQAEYRLRRDALPQGSQAGATTLLHLAYDGNEGETALKSLDFAETSVRSRWAAGRADMAAALERLAELPEPAPGLLSVHRLKEGMLLPAAGPAAISA